MLWEIASKAFLNSGKQEAQPLPHVLSGPSCLGGGCVCQTGLASNTSASSSPLPLCYPPAILEIVLSPLFIANVLMETFFIVFYSTGEINFQSGFGLSDFPPAQLLESCAGLLPFLAKVSLVP